MGSFAEVGVATEAPRGSRVTAFGVYSGARTLRPAARTGLPRALDLAYLQSRGFSAKAGEVASLPAGGGRTVLAVGLGSREELDADALREAGAGLARGARADRVTMVMSGIGSPGLGAAEAAEALALGVALASYDFREHKGSGTGTAGGSKTKIEKVTLVGSSRRSLESAASRAQAVAAAVAFARDLVNEPAGSLPPRIFAQRAADRCRDAGVHVEMWEAERIAAERLGGVIGVCQGSAEEPRFLRLSFRGSPGSRVRPVALVGKGVTFDSGGLSLKTPSGMEAMKTDMSGAAAVVAAISVLGALGLDLPVEGFVPLVENMPGGRAIRPGDVLRARNGKTIEVLNTDAEGRLILADALSLAVEARPQAIVDLATLTGACSIALGDRIAGLMATDDRLAARVESASAASGEKVWRLPLPSDYRKHIDSEVADIRNVGAPGGLAGTLTAGLFLKEFAGDGPWAHLDIAGPARSSSDEGLVRKGGTGFGVRLLVEMLGAWSGRA